MAIGFIGFPHVAGSASLAVNKGLLILQPLARLQTQLLCVIRVFL